MNAFNNIHRNSLYLISRNYMTKDRSLLVDYFMSQGASAVLFDVLNMTPFLYVLAKQTDDVVRCFLDRGYDVKESSKTLEFYHGEINRTMRLYQISHNKDQGRKWWARFPSEGRRRDIRRLQQDEHILDGLDRLLPFAGIRKPLKTTQIERILVLRSPEVTRCFGSVFKMLTFVDNMPLYRLHLSKIVRYLSRLDCRIC